MKVLDLFCGVGGASMGYYRAGFDVVGVDIRPQPRYPFEFHQADAMTFPLDGFDVIHASPPCQLFSQAVSRHNRSKFPDLLEPTRDMLRATGKPYVIENVERAPLLDAIKLCGSSFGLVVRRHRLFECNFMLMAPPCAHGAYPRIFPAAWNRETLLRVLSPSGGFVDGVSLADHKEAMQIDWDVTLEELSLAIPPAYTEYIGGHLMSLEER